MLDSFVRLLRLPCSFSMVRYLDQCGAHTRDPSSKNAHVNVQVINLDQEILYALLNAICSLNYSEIVHWCSLI